MNGGGGEPDPLEYHAPRRAAPLPVRDFVAGAASLALGLTSLIALGFRAFVLEDAMVRRSDVPNLAVVHSWWLVGVPTCALAIVGFFLAVSVFARGTWIFGMAVVGALLNSIALMMLAHVASS